MSISSKVNKENFRLLDLSSDEESEDFQLEIIPSKKKKIRRRERNRGGVTKTTEPSIGSEVQCALRWAVRGTLLLWLVMLTWICAALYDQVTIMRLDMVKVSTSSASVGDALQVCHTSTKVLHANTSQLHERLTNLEHEHHELVKQVEQALGELAAVSQQLAAAPKLADTPRRLAELQRTVADFGSQINGFDGALNSARKQAVTAATGVEEIKTLLHQLEARTNETIDNVTTNSKRENELKQDVVALNSTLMGRLETMQMKINELNKPASTLAPTSTTPVTSSTSTTSSTTTSTGTSTLPQGLPAKPVVLQ